MLTTKQRDRGSLSDRETEQAEDDEKEKELKELYRDYGEPVGYEQLQDYIANLASELQADPTLKGFERGDPPRPLTNVEMLAILRSPTWSPKPSC